jgi:beta-glucosidase
MSSPTSADVAALEPGADPAELGERIALLTGATSWTLHPLPSRGLRSITLSDGPIGVRGVDGDTRPSAQLPSPSALAATFDPELLTRLGRLIAAEARRKDVDVVLAPVVNLQRTPYGGRHFEAFSEDPLLTGVLASALISAAQDAGVGMCAKHFLGNESETERTSYIARIPERALREVYLAPFERVVTEAGVWSVMSAYNGVDDGVESAPATEHAHLIMGILKGEWGFDGVVVSDWLAATSTVESALGGLDLIMPGPSGPWGARLEAAVRDGDVAEAVIDDKVDRIVRLGERVGAVGAHPDAADDRSADPADPAGPATRLLLRETVARASVLLRNDGLLPLRGDDVASIALIGPNAVEPFVQGGGSASVSPPLLSTPEAALREALPGASIELHRGASGRIHAQPVDPTLVSDPDGAAGYRITFYDGDGAPIGAPRTVPADESWNRAVPDDAVEASIDATVRLIGRGVHRVEVGVSGAHRIAFDGEVVSASTARSDHDVILDSSANNPDGPVVEYSLDSLDGPREVRIESRQQVVDAGAYGRFVRFALRHELHTQTPDEELASAVRAAAAADVAIVVVGTNEETESEGWDRRHLQLPGRQNELVDRVLQANPKTVVIVNAGAPVVLPWIDRAAAVLWWWLPGQEAGGGLADALLGVTEPSGRLPWTLPATEDDVPVRSTTPQQGVLDYAEGIHVGYRGWQRSGCAPAREFGYGLGYGRWRYERLALEGSADDLTAVVTLANTADRDAREVVQLYLEAPSSTIERPARWLAGFAIVDVTAGGTATVRIPVERRSLEVWDVERQEWTLPAGSYELLAAHTSHDIRLHAPLTIHIQGGISL